jgi:hypothetical protein
MGTIWVKEFTGGLDTRRLPETTSGGVLIRALNGHISRGGEFEKRAAFVDEYSLPANTFGLAAAPSSLYVFGSAVAPVMPAGVLYQRLQHPSASPMVNVLSVDLYAGKLYVVAEFQDGSVFHFYDGARVTDWYDGRARATFNVVNGVGGGSPSTMSSIQVNGVSIMAGAVVWPGNPQDMASAIASSINSATSSPDYTAVASGTSVSIVASSPGAASNGFAVTFNSINSLVIDPVTGLQMANGSDASATYQPGRFVKTIGKKVYAVSGPNMHFSGISAPTKWTTSTVGAGFIDMSTEASGSEDLIALAKYQNQVAVFAEGIIQIWYTDPDPSLNRQSQVLSNTGTISPRSVTQFGDNDLFYLDESGLRSLRARDSSNAAATTDIGVPVDTLVVEKLNSLDIDERQKIIGLIEPRNGRFWLIVKDTIFVFSFFNGAKVSAWSTYTASKKIGDAETDFTIDDAVVFKRRVYVRAGDKIMSYGGSGSEVQYDDTVAEAWLPYLDADVPTREKNFTGIDAAVKGEWSVYAAMQPVDINVEDKVATITETTFNHDTIPGIGDATHISLRFRSSGSGAATLASAVIHYEGDLNED